MTSYTPVRMSQLEECDCCHDLWPIRGVQLCGAQFLCRKCREDDAALSKTTYAKWLPSAGETGIERVLL